MSQTVTFTIVPIKGNRPFPHSAPVNKHNETRLRFQWTISNKSLYFVNTRLQLVPLFTEMQENPIIIDKTLCCSALLSFCNSWSHDQLSVNKKIVCFWKILLAGTERAYKNQVTCKFSTTYLERSNCKGRRKQFLPPSHT